MSEKFDLEPLLRSWAEENQLSEQVEARIRLAVYRERDRLGMPSVSWWHRLYAAPLRTSANLLRG